MPKKLIINGEVNIKQDLKVEGKIIGDGSLLTNLPYNSGGNENVNLDEAVNLSKAYTDEKIKNLIGTSPENLDTIQELGEAITGNQDAIDLLESAVTNKADSDHTHEGVYQPVGNYQTAGSYASSNHTHDYSLSSHNHNDLYQPLGNYSNSNHTHDYSPSIHNHDGVYQPLGNYQTAGNYSSSNHTHSEYALLDHNHSGVYQPIGSYSSSNHTHAYSPLTHNHNDLYQPLGNYQTAGSYASSNHTHDSVNGHIIESDVPINAVFTDTTYSEFNITTSGLVPKPDSAESNKFLNSNGDWVEITMDVVADNDMLDLAKNYTDTKINDLIGTSPENLDTIQELGEAITGNKDAIDLLEDAITNKADKDHNHNDLYQPVGSYSSSNHTHAYSPSNHNHNDLYQPIGNYQTAGNYSPSTHNHEGVYQLVGSYASSNHTHDYSPSTHNHDEIYQPIGNYQIAGNYSSSNHAHSEYALLDHNHSSLYQPIGSYQTAGNYASSNHTHDYSPSTHNHSGIYQPVGSYASSSHTHNYSPSTHNHSGIYQPVGSYSSSDHTHDYASEINNAISSANLYTDEKIKNLIGTSPENLDTIQELGEAITGNKDAIDLLELAITNKADSDHTHETVNGFTVMSNVPSNAVFTDTTYSEFSTSSSGLVPVPNNDCSTNILYSNGEWIPTSRFLGCIDILKEFHGNYYDIDLDKLMDIINNDYRINEHGKYIYYIKKANISHTIYLNSTYNSDFGFNEIINPYITVDFSNTVYGFPYLSLTCLDNLEIKSLIFEILGESNNYYINSDSCNGMTVLSINSITDPIELDCLYSTNYVDYDDSYYLTAKGQWVNFNDKFNDKIKFLLAKNSAQTVIDSGKTVVITLSNFTLPDGYSIKHISPYFAGNCIMTNIIKYQNSNVINCTLYNATSSSQTLGVGAVSAYVIVVKD